MNRRDLIRQWLNEDRPPYWLEDADDITKRAALMWMAPRVPFPSWPTPGALAVFSAYH
jgi:hypothetical protein